MPSRYESYTFPYTLNELTHPQGRNGLATSAKFYQRSMYKEAIYPEGGHLPKPLDTWYDKNLYGRVDPCQTAVAPVKSNLSLVRKAAPNVYCLNFVEIAFNVFASDMATALVNGCLIRDDSAANPQLWNIKAVRGYTDPYEKYNAFMNALIDSFAEEHVDGATKVIKNFKDFIPLFRDYLLYVAHTYPINRENFFLSNTVSPYMTGLSLAISRHSAADDNPKYEDYINDPNFEYYVQSAKEHGFLVNKNMPWILTADLFTNAIQKYMNYFTFPVTDADGNMLNITPNSRNFFYFYYNRVYQSAFSNLKYIFAHAYSRFRQQRPIYAQQSVIWRECRRTPVGAAEGPSVQSEYREHNFFRQKYDRLQTMEDMLDDEFLIDLYVRLRHIESDNSYPSTKNVFHRAREVYGLRPYTALTPMQNVLKYVNDIYRVYVYPPNYGNINQTINLDKLIQTDIMDTGVELVTPTLCGSGIAIASAAMAPPEEGFPGDGTEGTTAGAEAAAPYEYGCTDPSADNYSPLAVVDDGSCVWPG